MKIDRVQDNNSKGFFRADDNGTEAGMMTYSVAGTGKIIIDHTEVNPAYSGKGVGKQLVMAAVDYARKNNIKIMPLCTFASSVFQKDASIQDVMF